jgi:hypothetical protein
VANDHYCDPGRCERCTVGYSVGIVECRASGWRCDRRQFILLFRSADRGGVLHARVEAVLAVSVLLLIIGAATAWRNLADAVQQGREPEDGMFADRPEADGRTSQNRSDRVTACGRSRT